MSLVEGFMSVLQSYSETGQIFLRQSVKSDKGILCFIQNIFQLMGLSEGCFVSMVVYFHRLIQRQSGLINDNNLMRFIFVSCLLAVKMQEDCVCGNNYFSQISGLALRELNSLELTVLAWVDYRLYVAKEEYDLFYSCLIRFDAESKKGN